MRKCYSLFSIAVAVSSLIVPQSALSQFTKVRPAQSLSTLEVKAAPEASARQDFAVKPRELKPASPFAQLRTGKAVPSFAAKNTPLFKASASSVIYGLVTYSDNWGGEPGWCLLDARGW